MIERVRWLGRNQAAVRQAKRRQNQEEPSYNAVTFQPTYVSNRERSLRQPCSCALRSQPRQIGDLEAELGFSLFDRVRRRLILTGEGEQLLGDCRVVLGAVGSMGERAQLLRRGDAGVLKVSATPQTIDGVLSNFLLRYKERRPNVQVKLIELSAPPYAMFERGEFHVAISLLRHIKADNYPVETLLLPPLEFLAVSNPSLHLGTARSMELRSLGSHPLLLLDSSFFVRRPFDAACRLADFKPNILFESRTPHALLALAEAGHGVAIVPSVLPTHRYRLRTVRLMHRRKPLREPYGLVWDKRRTLPPYAQDFCQSLAAYMREVSPISEPSTRKARRVAKRSSA